MRRIWCRIKATALLVKEIELGSAGFFCKLVFWCFFTLAIRKRYKTGMLSNRNGIGIFLLVNNYFNKIN